MKTFFLSKVPATVTILTTSLAFCMAEERLVEPKFIAYATQFGQVDATNGFRGEIVTSGNYVGAGHDDIWVYAGKASETHISSHANSTNISLMFYFGQPSASGQTNLHRYPYFQALNSFCGPIELRDASGGIVPLLKPEVTASNMYPASFRLNKMPRSELFGKKIGVIYLGPPWPKPLIMERPLLTRFQLADYFAIKQPGDYQLTVWPKIYGTSVTDKYLCERIDLPPVSVTLRW